MTNTELSELFLSTVYDEAERKGHDNMVSLDEVAKKFGVTDRSKVYNVAKYLNSRGLIMGSFKVGETSALLTGEGAIFVERGGNTGIIQKYRANPASFIVTIDSSTKIYGNVLNSNLSSHSSQISQMTSNVSEIEKIIMQMFDAVNQDITLSKEQVSDAIQDIETLKLQISKTNKNKMTIESTLSSLSNISSIASFLAQLYSILIK